MRNDAYTLYWNMNKDICGYLFICFVAAFFLAAAATCLS